MESKSAVKKISHKQIIKMVCNKTGGSEEEVQKHINCYIDTIMEQMCSGHNVGIQYLGTMRVERVAKKPAWDFQLQRNVVRPSRTLPKMSFNREFSNRIKNIRQK
jgi:nucleoid DNA-binding protein